WQPSSSASWPLLPSPLDDSSPDRPAHGPGGLALLARDRRGEARPPDQQLPPPARRGHLRRVRAAADRVALEELPDDGPRGDRRGQDHLRVPPLAPPGAAPAHFP